ncbi:MAG: UDP-N-acetylmuramoyl-L-alanyl-D-glutamate--2,6-diaminopimelate ligase [Fretibacterium sp.]|nr:UDP-N-acetylmuramoyl-L-alanyl-D-glutamate--2,6-diaminopimelate ligase [Fretibacterium sp.]
MSMKFSEVCNVVRRHVPEAEERNGDKNPVIGDAVSDSRQVVPGTLFCCIKGETSDGHDYIRGAEERGACALLCERPVDSNLPMIIVPSVREVMGEAAAAVYEHPAERLLMVGVTGTNGKTTTTYVLRSLLQAAGIRTGLLGTIVENDGITERDADRTTPESCVVQRQLAAMVKNGCGACVMETSSHGLFLGRLKGALYDVPIFTNLYPEHLDFHKDMETYFQAKRLLFTHYAKPGFKGAANAGDPYGQRLIGEFPEGLRGFALKGEENAFARVTEWQTALGGTSLTMELQGLDAPLCLRSPLAGEFNVWNVLCAVTALWGRPGINEETIRQGVAAIPQVPGRLERHVLPNGACCFIDFAHTPSALRKVLTTVRGLTKGRVLSLFGHGGGRYSMNRPELGRVAAELADEVIVTMDNPRDEDPADIAQAIVKGVEERGGAEYQVILDRREAVRRGLSLLGPDDVMVVSGKGPEKYLQIGRVKHPYNDAETVDEWCRRPL